MNITAKSRYALKIMMDLSLHEEGGHQQRHNIAVRQGIPLDFMDQVTARLRSASLIESIRGRSGGFKLSKASPKISLWDIFQAVEDNLYPVKCLDHEKCALEGMCVSIDAWDEVFSILKNELQKRSLQEVVDKWRQGNTHMDENAPSPITICSRPHYGQGS
ncbi:MAG: Rrf2 family transcriptional regulator [Deltaproteobacteria bacterium]|nr:Rrf2 family transcriptional regulator [Deltaproteobacteria bacterium]